jgi:hypothetical protein
MKTTLAIACLAALSLSSATASAQGWAWVPAPGPAVLEEGPPCPAQEGSSVRERIRDLRRVDRLIRIMAVEGPEFSQERYEAYRRKQVGGALMIPLGVISIYSGLAIVVVNSFDGFSSSEDDWDGEEDGGGYGDDDDGLNPLVGLGAGMMILGAASIGIGIPLVIKGTMGKNRQRYLQRKHEILGAAPLELGLGVRAGPDGGGLALAMTF